MSTRSRYFGTPEQQELERRADLLWQVIGGDPRYSTHGRAVALIERSAESVDLQIALAQLQGVGPSPRLPTEVMRARKAALEEAGLVTDFYDHWTSSATTLTAAEELLARRSLPEELSVHQVTADTTDEEYDALDRLTQSCEVLLPASAFLCGDALPAICLYAKTADGEAVGVAATIAENPPGSSDADLAWWGMLSTAGSWRGRGVAKLLGAMVLVEMAEKFNLKRFGTGIRSDNVESAALCSGLGFSNSGLLDLIAVDTATMSGGRLTK